MLEQPIRLFNSYGRELQEFVPVQAHRVRLYTCGLTVYDYAHLGNLRAYIFTDTLRRVLQWKGFDVLHVMNITDVGHLTSDEDEGDDKMELAAHRRQKSVWELAEYYTEHFKRDLAALNIKPPSVWCKATDHIQEMIDFARVIDHHGWGYLLPDGFYLDTSKVTDYGRLALLDLEGQQEGKRVSVKEGKRNPSDFAIWRRSPSDAKRQMEWHSPWGVGVPGWHLECSVMSLKYLGTKFDIHTGGIDHRQVHHCNEIAQNEAYLGAGQRAVNYWLHNEFLTFGEGQEKMSKSSGRFVRLQDLQDWGLHPLSYRHFVLMAKYRHRIEFSFDALVSAHNGLLRMLRRIEALRQSAGGDADWIDQVPEHDASRGGSHSYLLESLCQPLSTEARSWVERMDEALSNDLNTPQALALLSEVLADTRMSADTALRLIAILDLALGLDLLTTTPGDLTLRPATSALDEAAVTELLAEREALRQKRDFAQADEIRDRLLGEGVAVEDSRSGASWEWTPLRPKE